MNEFARKAMELAEEFAAQSIWLGYYEEGRAAYRKADAKVDAARAALVAHLEGAAEQQEKLTAALQEIADNDDECRWTADGLSWIAKEALLPATPTEEQP